MWSLLSGDRQASRLRAALALPAGICPQDAVPGTRIAMLQTEPRFVEMKRILLTLCLALLLVAAPVSIAQIPDANQEAKLLELIKDVQKQQAQLAENQAKIEEKIAAVNEIVKDARLYSKRVR